jgi:hypothetical protein
MLAMRLLISAAMALLLVAPVAGAEVRLGQPAPEISGERWINTGPLTMAGLRGRVVFVEFWTFG